MIATTTRAHSIYLFHNKMLLEALDPIIDKNIDRTRAGILFADSRDPARQQQINKLKNQRLKLEKQQL